MLTQSTIRSFALSNRHSGFSKRSRIVYLIVFTGGESAGKVFVTRKEEVGLYW